MGFMDGAMSGASTGGMLGGPWGAAIGGIGGGILGLFGGKKSPQPLYSSDQGKPGGQYDKWQQQQMGQIYGSDPNAFWGGQNAWTTSGDEHLPQGAGGLQGLFGRALGMGGGGGGGGGGGVGGGGGASGYGASGYGAKGFAAQGDFLQPALDSDEAFQILPSQRIKEAVLGGLNEGTQGQVTRTLQDFEQQAALTGEDTSGKYGMRKRAEIQREGTEAKVGGYRQFFSDFTAQSAGRRAQGLISDAQNKTQASIATASNMTGASIATAQNKTSASIASAGNRTQASIANASIRSSNAQFNAGLKQQQNQFAGQLGLAFMGMRGQDEDRMVNRYFGLQDRNHRERVPVGQTQPEQSGFSKFMSGAAGGLNMFNQLGGMFGMGGGGTIGSIDGVGPPTPYGYGR